MSSRVQYIIIHNEEINFNEYDLCNKTKKLNIERSPFNYLTLYILLLLFYFYICYFKIWTNIKTTTHGRYTLHIILFCFCVIFYEDFRLTSY